MYFSMRPSRRALLTELTHILTVAPHKSAGPIETHVLIDAESGPQNSARLHVSNLDESFTSTFQASIDAPGRLALPTRKLHDYIRLLPEGEISITAAEPATVTVKMGRSKTRFTGINPDIIPPIKPAAETVLRIEADLLSSLLRRTRFAISGAESRYTLNCVNFALSASALRVVSTDGNRLALLETPFSSSQTASSFLLPASAIDPLLALAAAPGSEEVQIGLGETGLDFTAGRRRLSARRITGNFPNYDAVLPRNHAYRIELPRLALLAAIERTVQFADVRNSAIKISVQNGIFEISAASSGLGESREAFDIEFEGQPFSSAYRADFLSDFLRVLETSPTVSFSFLDAQSSAELRPDKGESSAYRYVVMPCRI